MRSREKGSVTMVVVVTIFFIVIILSSFLIYTSSRRKAQIEETRRIANAYDGNMGEIYNEKSKNEKTAFSSTYGRIDVIWIDTNNNVIAEPLEPNLGDLTPIKWSGTREVTTNKNDSNWYSYIAENTKEDNNTSRWANAKDKNGSYFVWIPRYAYRITYYSNQDSTKPTGYSDGRGIVDVNGNVIQKLDDGIKTIDYNGNSYIVHPAFMNDAATGYNNGGWDSELSGIWISKFEVSRSDATKDNEGNLETIKSVPNVVSIKLGNDNINSFYDKAIQYDTTKSSHLQKNSEYGAVVYLTHSQYGRNGHEVDINNSAKYITGNGGGSPDANPVNDTANAYNTSKGQKASSTGNIYGVYDLSGGAWEHIAAFDAKGNERYLDYGSEFTQERKSSKYATAYINGTTTYNGDIVYSVGKTGDATKEVFDGNNLNWFNDEQHILYVDNPFFVRGGAYERTTGAGIFNSGWNIGSPADSGSFHLILAF